MSAKRTILTPRGALLGIVLFAMLFTSAYPLRRYLEVKSTLLALQQEDRTLDDRIAELTERKTLLESDAEVERLARETLGMVRPGEVPFLVLSPRPVPSAPDVRARPVTSAKPALVSRWWRAVKAAARAVL